MRYCVYYHNRFYAYCQSAIQRFMKKVIKKYDITHKAWKNGYTIRERKNFFRKG